MLRKTVSGIMLIILLTSMLTFVVNIRPVRAQGTIYIRAEGSIDPPTAPISSVDNVTYTFTANIYDSIVVQRDNIVVDGAGYTVQGTGSGIGIDLSDRGNVTVRNTQITTFLRGIGLWSANHNNISGNNFANNAYGILLGATFYIPPGVWVGATCNTISGNNIANNMYYGIGFSRSCNYNTISDNNITNNGYWGIYLRENFNNEFYHNNFFNNTKQVYDISWDDPSFSHSINVWDHSYPSGGNFWSDYMGNDTYSGPYQNETGSDGIGDSPYVIDGNNQDNYPFTPWPATTILETSVTKGRVIYPVEVMSNATITDFRETPGAIKLSMSGEYGTSAYVRIIQPLGLNSTNIRAFLNNTKLSFPSVDPPRSISSNGTHYFIYFMFTFASSYEITIAFPVEGDVNYDGVVNMRDIGLLCNSFGSSDPHYDTNEDNIVNMRDIGIACSNFMKKWE